jgi:ABC-type lipoprotein release transport system permease subunit
MKILGLIILIIGLIIGILTWYHVSQMPKISTVNFEGVTISIKIPSIISPNTFNDITCTTRLTE